MTERAKIDRPISTEEIAVIRSALERAAVSPEFTALAAGLDGLRAIDRCSCGCDSVDFAKHDPSRPAKPIGDGIGTTPAGGTVGVIVWGRPDAITGLEVYDLGAGDNDLKLPTPSSIRSFVKVLPNMRLKLTGLSLLRESECCALAGTNHRSTTPCPASTSPAA